jgi:hypothetical protein
MEWLALSLAFIATMFFSLHYPSFRRGLAHVAVVLIATTIAVVAAIGLFSWVQSLRTEARRQAASKLIKPEQIELVEPSLTLGTPPSLAATILNKSKYDLAELEIRILLSDCPAASRAASISEKEWGEFIRGESNSRESKTAPRTNMFDDLIPRKPVEGMFDDLPDLTRSPSKADTSKNHGKECGVVGEHVAQVSALHVPKGQKRALNTPVHFSDLPTLSEWNWSYSIERAFAKYR